MPDAAAYGDAGSDTLGHIASARVLHLPNMAQLGLGNLKPLPHVGPVERPIAAYGKCALASPGKDTTTGHWEMVGIHLAKPFPLFPHGFPPGRHAGIREPHRARDARQLRRLRHRDHPATRRGTHAHRPADCLHFGRQRLSSGRARRSDPAVGAVQDLRNRARDAARAAGSGARDRQALHRTARLIHPHIESQGLRGAAAARHAAGSTAGPSTWRYSASARSSTCSWAAASANTKRPRTTPTAWRRRWPRSTSSAAVCFL